MIRSVDPYLKRQYTNEYTCLEFAAEVWEAHTGEPILADLKAFHADDVKGRRATRRRWIETPKPVEPCIVLMQGYKLQPHVGVFLRGRVLHLSRNGAEFQSVKVASRCFETARFYQCKS